MSQCPQCYTGTCKRHKRQDHGQALKSKVKDAKGTLNRMFDQIVGAQLSKLKKEANVEQNEQQRQAYREKVDKERSKALKKSKKSSASISRKQKDLGLSGLNPQAIQAMAHNDSSDSDMSYNSDTDSDEEDSEDGRRRRKKSSKKRKRPKDEKKKSRKKSSR